MKQAGDGVSSERGFEGEIQALGDGALQQAFSLMPGGAVDFLLSAAGIRGANRRATSSGLKYWAPLSRNMAPPRHWR